MAMRCPDHRGPRTHPEDVGPFLSHQADHWSTVALALLDFNILRLFTNNPFGSIGSQTFVWEFPNKYSHISLDHIKECNTYLIIQSVQSKILKLSSKYLNVAL